MTSKGKTITLSILALVILFVFGCGVGREEHEKVLTELKTSKAELENANQEIMRLGEKIVGLKKEMASFSGKAEAFKALEEKLKEYQSLEQEMAVLTKKYNAITQRLDEQKLIEKKLTGENEILKVTLSKLTKTALAYKKRETHLIAENTQLKQFLALLKKKHDSLENQLRNKNALPQKPPPDPFKKD